MNSLQVRLIKSVLFLLMPLVLLLNVVAAEQDVEDIEQYTFKVQKDVPYLGADRKEKMDLYLPEGKAGESFPAILIIHGGGWSGGKKDDRRETQMGEVFAKAGFVAASIDYQMYDKVTSKGCWPQCLHDCKTAVRFLKKNAGQYGVKPDGIGVIGGSAGGHLSMLVAFTGGNEKLDPSGPYSEFSTVVRAAVDMYGIPDNAGTGFGRAPLLGKGVDDPEALKQASPVTHADKNIPALMIMHGTEDKTVPFEWSEKFNALLKERGIPCEFIRVDGAPHTFLINSKCGDFRKKVIDFFRKNLTVK